MFINVRFILVNIYDSIYATKVDFAVTDSQNLFIRDILRKPQIKGSLITLLKEQNLIRIFIIYYNGI